MISCLTVTGIACLALLRIFYPEKLLSRDRDVFKWALSVVLLSSLFCLMAVKQRLTAPDPISENIVYNLEKIEKNVSSVENILIIEGGSSAARAINPDLLRDKLKELGFDVLVINFCIPGANHYERLWMFDMFGSSLSETSRGLMAERNVVVLHEAYPVYDQYPSEQMSVNLYRDRTLSYLRPDIACALGKTVIKQRKTENGKKADSLNTGTERTLINIAGHGLINLFNIGLPGRTEPLSDIAPEEARYFNLRAADPKSGNYIGMAKVRERLRGRDTPELSVDTSWVVEIHRSEEQALALKVKRGCFALPTQFSSSPYYIENYRKEYSLLIAWEEDMGLIDALDDPSCWFNRTHLSGKGSAKATEWLAGRLAETEGLIIR